MRRILVTSGLFLAALFLQACGGGYGSSYGGGGGGTGFITSIVISPATASITVSGTKQFKAVAKDANGNTVTGAALVWKSSNTAVASVNSAGLATALAVGSTSITASITYNSGGYNNMPVTYTSNAAMLTVTTADQVMGTAATGHALAGALVTLVDAHGRSVNALSDTDGRFLLSTAGLTAPFLLKAEDGRGLVMFGVAAEAGVANIDTVTDVMLRAWYAARGSEPAAAFATGTHLIPGQQDLKQLNMGFGSLLQDTLASQGLDVSSFDLFSTPFTADSTGFDRVLDHSMVRSTKGRLRLVDGLAGKITEIRAESGALSLETRTAGMPQLTSTRRLSLP
jgi:hypothetical protein